MTDRIYIRDGEKLIEKIGARDPAKTYSDIGTGQDGARRLLEWSGAESAARAVEVAAWIPIQPKDELAEIKSRLAALEAARVSR